MLYIGPYLLGTQMTLLTGNVTDQVMPLLVSSKNPDLALPLCYLSARDRPVLGVVSPSPTTSARRPTRRPTGRRRGGAR